MDFKAALLKSQPGTTVVHAFKPTAGNSKPDGKKEKDSRPADSFNASGDEGRINVMKVGRPLSYFPLATLKITDVGSTSARATALEDVTSTPAHHRFGLFSTPIRYPQL